LLEIPKVVVPDHRTDSVQRKVDMDKRDLDAGMADGVNKFRVELAP
jgi:hypothetical protein